MLNPETLKHNKILNFLTLYKKDILQYLNSEQGCIFIRITEEKGFLMINGKNGTFDIKRQALSFVCDTFSPK